MTATELIAGQLSLYGVMMKPFREWWQKVIAELDHPREIRNWTPLNGYTIGGTFVARSYRSLPRETQSAWNDGYPFQNPNDWIVCTQVKAEGVAQVSKKEFQVRYDSWRNYKNNRIIRKDFDGETKASSYLISIFHRFDELI